VISQERLNIVLKLLLSANKKSYMPRWLAPQWMTLSDMKWQPVLVNSIARYLCGSWASRSFAADLDRSLGSSVDIVHGPAEFHENRLNTFCLIGSRDRQTPCHQDTRTDHVTSSISTRWGQETLDWAEFVTWKIIVSNKQTSGSRSSSSWPTCWTRIACITCN